MLFGNHGGDPWYFEKMTSSCSGCSCSSSSAPASRSGDLPVPKIRKSLQNTPELPWFDWIANGTKRYEGRLRRDEWAALSVNDKIVFISPDNRELFCRVVSLPCFESFGAAFDALGSALVPVPGVNTADVIKIYGQYYSEENIRNYGVVAVEVEPLSQSSIDKEKERKRIIQ